MMPEDRGSRGDMLTVIANELGEVRSDIKAHAAVLAELKGTVAEQGRTVQSYAREVENLVRMLRGNNGKDSMIVRFALMEEALGSSTNALKEVQKILEARAAEESKGKFSLIVAIITGLIGLLSVLFSTMLKRGP